MRRRVGAPNPDPSYPAYEPYDPANTPMASTGEYGLNVNNGNIASPQTFRDFMSYAGPAWISLYHYGRLLDNDRLTPTTVGVDYPWWKDLVWEEIRKWPPFPEPDPPFDLELELPVFPPSRPQDVISLIVKVERGRVAEVLHVARLKAHTGLAGAVDTAFTVRLVDAERGIVAEGALLRLDTAAGSCACGGHAKEPTTYLAQAFVPDAGPGAALEIAEGDEVVWRREAPDEPPRVEGTEVKVDRRGNTTVSWGSSGKVVEFWVRWSRDGEDWESIVTGLGQQKVRIPAGQLPPGEGRLQVMRMFYDEQGDADAPFARPVAWWHGSCQRHSLRLGLPGAVARRPLPSRHVRPPRPRPHRQPGRLDDVRAARRRPRRADRAPRRRTGPPRRDQ